MLRFIVPRLKRNYPISRLGVIAQLGERLPCTQEVSGSIPLNSTIPCEGYCLKTQRQVLPCEVFLFELYARSAL